MPIGICDFCLREKEISKNRETNKNICPSCRVMLYRSKPENHKKCCDCGRMSPSAGLKEDGQHLCSTCIAHYRCRSCGKKASSLVRGSCSDCIARKTFSCGICGNPSKRVTPPHLCPPCNTREYRLNKEREVCIYCNKLSAVAIRFSDGSISCGNCRKKYLAPENNCSICNRLTYIFYNKKYKINVCGRCDTAIREGKI